MSTTLAHQRPPAPSAARRTPPAVILTLTLLAVLAFWGALRLPGVLFHNQIDPNALPSVDTSYGLVTVTGHELLDGPSPEELGGVTHGIGGYVDSEHALMRVHLQVTGADAIISPANFSLVLPDKTRLAPEMNTLPAEVLPDGATIDTSLSFVLPRGSGDYQLLVMDGDTQNSVPLGKVNAVPRPAAHNH